MSWYRTDDTLTSHPKWVAVKRAAYERHRDARAARAAAQRAALAWFAIGVWGAKCNCDGIIPAHAADQIAPGMFLTEDEFVDGADLLIAGGMCRRLTKANGGPGWHIPNWKKYQPSRAQVALAKDREQRRKDLYRTVEGRRIVALVKQRDGDWCRYCWEHVDWNDRRSAHRGTLDHVDPDGPSSVENVVVACGSCNRRKSDRTPDEAEMLLRAPYMSGADAKGEDCDLAGSGREQVATSSRPSLTRGSGRARSGQVGPDRGGSGRARSGRSGRPSPSSDDAPPHTDDHAPADERRAR
jgi:HNH endonuclease